MSVAGNRPVPDEPFGLDDAYAVETPEDSRRLYRAWADTYDEGFIAARGYVYHRRVAQAFVDTGGVGPVLDIGCGTGIVGQAVRALGVAPVDGIDISPEMLAKAATKTADDGSPVYRTFLERDFTEPSTIAEGSYGGVISVGIFTHGHLGPDAFDTLYRLGSPGARFAIGINAEFFADEGFAARLDTARDRGLITPYELRESEIYTAADDEYAGDTALIALFGRA